MNSLQKRITGSIVFVIAAALCTQAAQLRHEPIRGVNTGLPENELAWRELAGGSEEEHIFMIGFFEGGIYTFTTIFTFKYGPFHKWGYYTLLQEDGVEGAVFVKGECPENKTKVSNSNYDITCGDTSYSGKWPNYILKLRDPELTADITFRSMAKPYTPGKFLLTPDKKIYLECTVYQPRAKTEASLKFRGKTVRVKGEGYADYSYQNFPFTRQGKVYYAVRAFPNFETPPEDQFYLNFSTQDVHEAYGGGYDSFGHIVRNDKIITATRNLTIEPLQTVTDPDTGYKYVKRVAINMDDSGSSFKGTFSVTKTIEIMDIFQWVPPYARKVAAKFFKRPVYFRFLGNLEGQLKTKEGTFAIKQRATSEMNFTQ